MSYLGMVLARECWKMSALAFIYDEFKKDGFAPRLEAICHGPNDDLSVWLHAEVPECQWFAQWQRKNWPQDKATVPYWDPAPKAWGMWMLLSRN